MVLDESNGFFTPENMGGGMPFDVLYALLKNLWAKVENFTMADKDGRHDRHGQNLRWPHS